MAGSGMTLVLCGNLCQSQSADMRPLWDGFIELQKRLPSEKSVEQIVVHSWNPELADLASVVYEPQVECHEPQRCIEPELMQQIESSIRFDQGSEGLQLSKTSEKILLVLGEASSRARAVQLMEQLSSENEQVLITRWDLGLTDRKYANQLVLDAVLPEEYLYLPYSAEVDEGYSDIWMLAPWQLARRFRCFDRFVFNALSGSNPYLELFTSSGWPRARNKTKYEVLISSPVGQRLHATASKIIRTIQDWSRGDNLLQKIMRRLTGRAQRFLARPPITAENSCVHAYKAKLPVYPAPWALNINAIMKYFILSEGLRGKTRFLSSEDFELTSQSGQLINPQSIILLIRDADEGLVKRLAESPIPLAAIYQIDDDVVREYLPDGNGGWDVSNMQPMSVTLRDQITCALSMITSSKGQIPVVLMAGIERYLACTDWYYMNALMKYIAWRKLDYVGLEHTQHGKPYFEFPDLHMVQSNSFFSQLMGAGTVDGIRKYINDTEFELENTDHTNKKLLEFPVVVRGEKLF